jgi:Uma2 family endonuclease
MEPSVFDPALVTPRRFSVEEYHRLVQHGVLHEDDRVELMEGVIVEMTPQNRLHAYAISELNNWLVPLARSFELRVRVQSPLSLSEDSEPEPDLAVVEASEEKAAPEHPRKALLIVEAAGDSLRKDRVLKGRLYAAAGIPEYWIVNVINKTVEVYSDPLEDEGRYRSLRTLSGSQPLEFRSNELPVRSLFGE